MKTIFGKPRGQVMVLYAGVLAVLLGAIGLCTDVGLMYINWQQLQKAADAAVLAGANYLPKGPATALSTAPAWPSDNSPQPAGNVGAPFMSADVQVTAIAAVQNIGGAGGDHLVPIGFICTDPSGSPCASNGDKILLPGEVSAPPGALLVAPGEWGEVQFNDGQQYTGSHFPT